MPSAPHERKRASVRSCLVCFGFWASFPFPFSLSDLEGDGRTRSSESLRPCPFAFPFPFCAGVESSDAEGSSSSMADSGIWTATRTPRWCSICTASAPAPSWPIRIRARLSDFSGGSEDLVPSGGVRTSAKVRIARCAGTPHNGNNASSSIVSATGARGEGVYDWPLSGRDALRRCVRLRGWKSGAGVRGRGCGARWTRCRSTRMNSASPPH